MRPACRFDPRARRWRDGSGRFMLARRGRRRSDRLERAIELVALRCVHTSADASLVFSADGRHVYRVRLEDRACTCLDATYRPSVTCKHALAAAVAARRLGALMRRVEP